MSQRIRVFATCDIGDALNILRDKGYDVEVYPRPQAPPKSLIIEKVKSGVDGLITTLRDPIDAEVFAAGKGSLKVVAQIAVGFDNINRADANKYKVPFTNTADVLTEATAEFAFFLMGALARKLWPAEHLTRENRWGYWHPYLPFLGDEVTGKTVAIIGTGRIGLAMIKKCAGFDMNILCFDPAYENRDYIKAIQEMMNLSFQRGISGEKTSIRYTTLNEALSAADFISLHVPLLREGESFVHEDGDVVDAYYFGVRFLDLVGFWDEAKQFWTTSPLKLERQAEVADNLLRGLTALRNKSEEADTARSILKRARKLLLPDPSPAVAIGQAE